MHTRVSAGPIFVLVRNRTFTPSTFSLRHCLTLLSTHARKKPDSMTTPVYDERDAGLLMVFSDPGSQATVEEFNDWYDNEHVPLRTKKFTTFLTAARYHVTSSSYSSQTDPSPSLAFQSKWSAIYTISSNSLFEDPAYTSLRNERSPREAELLSRIGVLDRRIYRLVYDSNADGAIDITHGSRGGIGPAPADLKARTGKELEEEARYVVATSVTPAAENKAAYDEWYAKEHVAMLKKVPGWKRTRRYELIDALVNGKDVKSSNGDGKQVPLCLGLHEYTTEDFEETAEYKEALNTPWRQQVIDGGIVSKERRVMKLYRAWDAETALRHQQQQTTLV